MDKTGRQTSTIPVVVIALSLAGVIVLWFYSNTEESLIKSLILLCLLSCISLGIFILISRYLKARHNELKSLISHLTTEVDAQNSRLEASKLQADQINQQLQLSVKYANTMSQQAAEATRSKGEFLAGMSHHIRTPMNAIIGFSEILIEDDLTPVQQNQVKIIRDSSRALLRLINDLFDFSKIESGRFEVDNNSDVNVNGVLKSVDAIMQPAAIEKGLIFEIIRQPGADNDDLCVHADASRFKQCLMNLVGNAVKFTKKGFVRVRVSSAKESGKPFIRFDVEDSGIGIAAENLNRIFEPFSQIETSDGLINHQFSSTGLGLAVTHYIAEMLGGKLVVSSTFSKGSVFSLYVPATVTDAAVKEQPQVKTPAAKEPNVTTPEMFDVKLSGKILVAEDSPTNQTLIDLILKKVGLKTKIVDNGLLAVQKIAEEKFDLILMDIQMPVMNGFEATRQIKKDHPEIPIVALTACAMMGDDEKCYSAGCDGYLTKPIDRKKLIETLKKYLSAENKKQNQNVNNINLDSQENRMIQSETNFQTGEIEIDWQLLMERIGDEALVDEIMPVFLKDNKERIQLLAEAVKRNDSGEVKFYAHSIKGACGTIGAPTLFELGKQLENAGRLEETDKYAPLFEQIKTHFDSLLALLNHSDWKQIVKNAQAPARRTS
ncbi:MAG: hypothetical protein A2Y10_14020 [Planctomycetes bacterium GWF2_41_51]|nr:MAG: hypothetical protein A2Y10_14020 [Planctomycetes bacterium GWF2_41_51]